MQLIKCYNKYKMCLPSYGIFCLGNFYSVPHVPVSDSITTGNIIEFMGYIVSYFALISLSVFTIYYISTCPFMYDNFNKSPFCKEFTMEAITSQYIVFGLLLLIALLLVNIIIYYNYKLMIFSIILNNIINCIVSYIGFSYPVNDVYPIYIAPMIIGIPIVPLLYCFVRHMVFVKYQERIPLNILLNDNLIIESINLPNDTQNQSIEMQTIDNNYSDYSPIESNFASLPNEKLCAVCMEYEKQYAFNNCGHKCICKKCKPFINQCPLCRKPGNLILIFE